MSDVNAQVGSDAAARQRSPPARRPAPAMTLPDAPSTRQWSPRRTRHASAPHARSTQRGLQAMHAPLPPCVPTPALPRASKVSTFGTIEALCRHLGTTGTIEALRRHLGTIGTIEALCRHHGTNGTYGTCGTSVPSAPSALACPARIVRIPTCTDSSCSIEPVRILTLYTLHARSPTRSHTHRTARHLHSYTRARIRPRRARPAATRPHLLPTRHIMHLRPVSPRATQPARSAMMHHDKARTTHVRPARPTTAHACPPPSAQHTMHVDAHSPRPRHAWRAARSGIYRPHVNG